MRPRYLEPRAVQDLLNAGAWDVFAAFHPEHVFLLTGFLMPLHRNTNPRTPVVAVISERTIALVVPRIQLAFLAQHEAGEIHTDVIITFGDFDLERSERASGSAGARLRDLVALERRAADWKAAVALALEQCGADESPLGCDTLPSAAAVAPWRAEPAADAMVRAVRRKNGAAVERLGNAASVAEAGLLAMLQSAQVGATEMDLHLAYRAAVAARGGTPGHVGIGVGDRSVLPINRPSTRRLAVGDIIKADVGALVDGFFADTACIVSVGPPPPRASATMEALLAGHRAALDATRADRPVEGAFQAAVDTVRTQLPAYRRPHCGHGIGVQRYEAPIIAAGGGDAFLHGEVVNIEIPYYEFGMGGLNVEDTVVVGQEQPRLLTRLPKDLLSIDDYLQRAADVVDTS